jgi:hypothetical protein
MFASLFEPRAAALGIESGQHTSDLEKQKGIVSKMRLCSDAEAGLVRSFSHCGKGDRVVMVRRLAPARPMTAAEDFRP